MTYKNYIWNCSIIGLILAVIVTTSFCQESEATRQFQYANKLMTDGLVDLAATQFEEFLKRYPDNPRAAEVYFQLGLLWQQQGNWQRSTESLQLLLLKYPDFPRCDEALFQIAENDFRAGHSEKALLSLERFALFYPKSQLAAQAYFKAGQLCYSQGDLIRAEQDFLHVLQDYPQSAWVTATRLQLSRLYHRKTDEVAAQAQIDQVLASAPIGDYLAQVSLLKAEILTDQYKLNLAEQFYKQLLTAKLSEIWQARVKWAYADYLRKVGRFTTARELIQPLYIAGKGSAIRDSVTYLWLRCSAEMGDDGTVLQSLPVQITTFKDSTLLAATLRLGVQCAVHRQAHDLAVQFLTEWFDCGASKQVNRFDLQAQQLELLRQYRAVGRTADALQFGQSLLEIEPSDWPFNDQMRFELGQIYLEDLKQPRLALFYFEQVLAPTHKSEYADDAAFAMARCYESLRDDQQAIDYYQNYSARFPGSPFLSQAAERLTWFRFYQPVNANDELGQISVLLTNLLLQKGREEVILALINQLFDRLKDYPRVIELTQNVIKHGLLQEQRQRLNQLLGDSYYRLALEQPNPALRTAQLDSARTYLAQYLAVTDDEVELARVVLLIHDIDRKSQGLTTSSFLEEYDFLSRLFNRISHGAASRVLNLRLGQLLADYGLRTAKDSVSVAVQIYSNLLSDSTNKTVGDEISLQESIGNLLPGVTVQEQALFYRSQAYLGLGEVERAQADLSRYQRQFPRGQFIVTVLGNQGKLAVHKQDWVTAEQVYTELVQRFYYAPIADSARIELAKVQIRLQKYDQVVKLLIDQQNSEAGLFYLAVGYRYLNQAIRVRELFSQYLSRYPNGQYVADVYLQLAEMAKQANQRQEAAYHYEQFLQRFPEDQRNLDVMISLVEQQYADGNYNQSLSQINTLLPRYLDDQALFFKRILCLARLGNLSAAKLGEEQFKTKFHNVDEQLAEIEYEIGNYDLEQKNFDPAEKQFKQVISQYKKSQYAVFAEYGLGKLKLVTNHTDEGLEILTRITGRYSEQPVLAQVYLTLGDYYYKTKQFDNALTALKRILELERSPSLDRTARQYLIKLYSDLGMYDSALIAIRQYLEKYPNEDDSFVYRIDFGITLTNLNEYDRAIENLQGLLPQADNEQEAEIRYWIGKNYFLMGQFRTAISEYLKVTYLTKPTKLPWHVTAEYESGLGYMKLKEWDRARELFNKIVKKEGSASDFGRVALRKLAEIDQLAQN